MIRILLAMIMQLIFVAPGFAQLSHRPLILLKQLGCYFCALPVYSLSIYSDGRVVYEGEKFVAIKGSREAKISPDEVQRLSEKFLKADFFSMQDSYSCDGQEAKSVRYCIVDATPVKFISFFFEGKLKTVEDFAAPPARLVELERDIEVTVYSHQWVHAVDDLKDNGNVMWDAQMGGKRGFTNLMQVSAIDSVPSIRQLLGAGANLNAQDESGWTSLMVASALCNAGAVNTLLEAGAPPDIHDSNGDTALIGVAAIRYPCKEQPAIFRVLVAKGADINAINSEGQTALIWAARCGNPDAVRVLIEAGAQINLRDKSGLSALDYAKTNLRNRGPSAWHKEAKEIIHILESGSTSSR